ncbi:MAG TPA: hypothetical protein VIK27_10655, partial [Candidatus Aquilonibacter sp.]
DRIEVSVEIDAQHNRVRATASGATAMVEDAARAACAEPEQRAAAARSLRCVPEDLREAARTALLRVYAARDGAAVVDERGVVRLVLRGAETTSAPVSGFEDTLARVVEARTAFGDVGRSLPDVYLVHGGRIADLRGLGSAAALLALAREEIAGLSETQNAAILTVRRTA